MNKPFINISELRQLVESGKPVTEIARIIGTTPSTIKVLCSNNGISLLLPPVEHSPRTVAHVAMYKSVHDAYADRAKKYRITPARLMNAILTIIVKDNLFSAVLDDSKEQDGLLRQKPSRYHRRAAPVKPGNGAAADHKIVTHPSTDGPDSLVLGKVSGRSPK
jgi:hypothetical protein